MANTTFISTSELDVGAYKEAQKTSLKAQSLFRDYNFEGSNMNVLLEVLARNTFNHAFYLNMVGSEMFLDSATLKESAVSRAKELNYVPRSRNSAEAVVNINITTANAQVSTITVPKGFYFQSASGGNTMLFSTNEAIILRNEGGSFSASNVAIYEGRIVTEYFVVDGDSSFPIASANADITSTSVTVQNSSQDTTTRIFNRAFNLYGLDENSLVYFVEGHDADQYRIVFGNGVTGVKLDDGNIVAVSYRDTSGIGGNGYAKFSKVSNIQDASGNLFNNITADTVIASNSGAERETLDSIKFNAPRHYSAQDRAVTPNDFTILIRNNFPSIQAIAVFGGEELEEKRYGKVVIATKPYGQEITPQNIKDNIASFLKERTTTSITPIFTDPDYYYIGIDSTVSYDTSVTAKTTSDIETIVRLAVDSYNTTYLYDFNSDFRFSKLTTAIDGSDAAITSNDTSVRMIKRITPIAGFDYNTTIKFGNAFNTTTNQNIVESSVFQYTYLDGVTYTARLIDMDGILVLIDDETGNTLQVNMGTVDYATGTVGISGLNVASYAGHINVYARLNARDVIIQRSQILNIDQADVSITIQKAVF